jgi:L-lactate dehydrogenase (cytochrome)
VKVGDVVQLAKSSARPRGVDAWTSVHDAERAAFRKLPRQVYEFVSGGAEDETTLRANRTAVERWALIPRVNRGISGTDLTTTILGTEHASPILLAPTGFTGVVRPGGEMAVARAARNKDITYIVSAAASNARLVDLGRADAERLWLNYYPLADAARGAALLDEAQALGYRTLVLTVDVPVAGRREHDVRNGFSIPPRLRASTVAQGVQHPGWSRRFLSGPPLTTPNLGAVNLMASSSTFPSLFRQDLNWSEVGAIRDSWQGHLVVKGVLSFEDARLAAEIGADAVVVSNHGGRQFDGAPSPLEVLQDVVDEACQHGLEVLVDSGFRRGREILLALALGASGVLIGRPYLYGLAGAGQVGVERVVALLREELHRSLHLLGLASVTELDRTTVHPRTQGPRR